MKKLTLVLIVLSTFLFGSICFTSCKNPSVEILEPTNSSEQSAKPDDTGNTDTTDTSNLETTNLSNPSAQENTDPTNPSNPGTNDSTDSSNSETTNSSNPSAQENTDPTNPSNPETTDITDPANTEITQEPEYTIATVSSGCSIKLSTEKAKEGTTITYEIICQAQYILKDSSALTIKDASGNVISTDGSSFVMPASDVTISVTAVRLPDSYGETKNLSYVFAGTTLVLQWDYDGPVDFISEYMISDSTNGKTYKAKSNYAIIKNFDIAKEHTLCIYARNIIGNLVNLSEAFKVIVNEFSIKEIETYYSKYNNFFVIDPYKIETNYIDKIFERYTDLLGVSSSISNYVMQGSGRAQQMQSNNDTNTYISLANQTMNYCNSFRQNQTAFFKSIDILKTVTKENKELVSNIGEKISEISAISAKINSLSINSVEDIELLKAEIAKRSALLESISKKQDEIAGNMEQMSDNLTNLQSYGNTYVKTSRNVMTCANNIAPYGKKLGFPDFVADQTSNASRAYGDATFIDSQSSILLNYVNQLAK